MKIGMCFFYIYNVESAIDEEINMNELVMVLNGIRNTDQLRYVMF